jgi:hypothetical protein
MAYYCSVIYAIDNSVLGLHSWDVSLADLYSKKFIIPTFMWGILPNSTQLFLKSTFFLTYRDIFSELRWVRTVSAVFLAFVVAFYAAFAIYLCWYFAPQPGQTWVENTMTQDSFVRLHVSVPTASVNLGLDLVVLLIPIVAVVQLNMSLRKKLGICLIFLTGLSACVASVLSIYFRGLQSPKVISSPVASTPLDLGYMSSYIMLVA